MAGHSIRRRFDGGTVPYRTVARVPVQHRYRTSFKNWFEPRFYTELDQQFLHHLQCVMLHINTLKESVMSYLSNGASFIVFGNWEGFQIDLFTDDFQSSEPQCMYVLMAK